MRTPAPYHSAQAARERAYAAAQRADSQHEGNKPATIRAAANAAKRAAREAREWGEEHAAKRAEEGAAFALSLLR